MAEWEGDKDIYVTRLPRTNKDFVGKRYGRLIARCAGSHDSSSNLLVLCDCDCGVEKMIRLANLENGSTKSCGCLKAERTRLGKKQSQADRAWLRMFPGTRARIKK